MSLAAKLPWTHRFAGGYPGIGSQPLPTDADAIDYLSRMATADGAGVETGVAVAVDAFFRDTKAAGVFSALKACCILAGARTLAGALVPLRDYGPELWDAPTPTIVTAGGTSPGSWDAASQTMSCTLGTTANTPRFQFNLGLVAGSQYVVSGRLTGDTASVTTTRLCIAVCGAPATISYNPSTGLLSGTVTAGGTSPSLELGLDATLGPASVTIESLSIREVIAAPTNVADGFCCGDYSRTSGLKGDGSTTYLDSGRASNADPQNDCHIAAYQAANATSIMAMVGAQKTTATESYSNFVLSGNNAYLRINNSTSTLSPLSGGTSVGLFVATRSDSSGYYAKTGSGSASFVSAASAQPSSFNTFVFANNSDGVAANAYDGTLSFYSIGTGIGSDGIAKLDTHITAYVTAIGAAI